jgi:hypothetical protein
MFSPAVITTLSRLIRQRLGRPDYVGALAQLWTSICREIPPGRANLLRTQACFELSLQWCEQLDHWTEVEWAYALRTNPFATLSALSRRCSRKEAPLSSEVVLLPESSYSQGVVQKTVVTNIAEVAANLRSKMVHIYVIEGTEDALTDSQTPSAFFFTHKFRFFFRYYERHGKTTEVKVVGLNSDIAKERLSVVAQSGGGLRILTVELESITLLLGNQLGSDENRFLVEDVKDSEAVADEFCNAITFGGQHGYHVVVMPELCGSPEIYSRIRNHLRNATKEADNPILTICPSRHEEVGSDNFQNVVRVLDSLSNEVKEFQHSKMAPVSISNIPGFSVPINEFIIAGETIEIVATPLGLISILICHDLSQAVDSARVDMLEQLPLSVLIRARSILLNQSIDIIVANEGPVEFYGFGKMGWPSGNSFYRSSRGATRSVVHAYKVVDNTVIVEELPLR